jgi:hypothetical protein
VTVASGEELGVRQRSKKPEPERSRRCVPLVSLEQRRHEGFHGLDRHGAQHDVHDEFGHVEFGFTAGQGVQIYEREAVGTVDELLEVEITVDGRGRRAESRFERHVRRGDRRHGGPASGECLGELGRLFAPLGQTVR